MPPTFSPLRVTACDPFSLNISQYKRQHNIHTLPIDVTHRSNFKSVSSFESSRYSSPHLIVFSTKFTKALHGIGFIFVRKYCKILFLSKSYMYSHKETPYTLYNKNFYGLYVLRNSNIAFHLTRTLL